MINPVYDPAELNSGHGHVHPRPDKVVARCGGPGLCAQCAEELAASLEASTTLPVAKWEPIQPGSPITEPTIAVPEDFQGSEAEAIALAVAGAVSYFVIQRNEAQTVLAATRQELVMSLVALEKLADAFPETSWASDQAALTEARDLLERLAPKLTT